MHDQPPAAPPAPRPPSARLTVLAGAVLAVSLGLAAWLFATGPAVGDVESATRDLPHIVGRALDLREATARARPWERRLYDLMAGDPARELELAIAWYAELADLSFDPAVEIQLVVLEAEAGRLGEARAKIERWPLPEPARSLLAAAYLPAGATGDGPAPAPDPAAVRPVLDGWFHDRVARRWAERTGDRARLEAVEAGAAARTAPLLGRVRALAALDAAVLAGGLGALAVTLRRRDRIGPREPAPPWTVRRGVEVLVRGFAVGVPLAFAAGTVAAAAAVAAPALGLLLPLPLAALTFAPVLLLARRHLAVPAGLGLGQALGAVVVPGAWPATLRVALALLGLTAAGDLVVAAVADRLGLTTHWTEWFTEELVRGGPAEVAVGVVGLAVLAPVLEELVFRGVVFATLRRRLPLAVAAVASGLLFALPHGYSWPGLAAVAWTGVVLAWAYERTGSLVPGILAHAGGNLGVSVAVLLLWRAA